MIIFFVMVPLWSEKYIVSQSKLNIKSIVPPYPVGIYLLKVNNRNTRTKC